jgi:hypothetical protein
MFGASFDSAHCVRCAHDDTTKKRPLCDHFVHLQIVRFARRFDSLRTLTEVCGAGHHWCSSTRCARSAHSLRPSTAASPSLRVTRARKRATAFAIALFVKLGGAVGVLPPESEKPNRRVLQAQLRILLVSTHASKRGLSSTADSLSRTLVESRERTSPSFWPDGRAARADPLRPVTTLS